jgi:hypothetical protein
MLKENNGPRSASELQKAQKAVEELQVSDFINTYKSEIFMRLEENYERAHSGKSEPESDLAFIADSLPLISAVIQVGSSKQSYDKACHWVQSSLPNANPAPVLSVLTFIYIVEKGYKEFSEDESKQGTWEKMSAAVKKSLKDQQ